MLAYCSTNYHPRDFYHSKRGGGSCRRSFWGESAAGCFPSLPQCGPAVRRLSVGLDMRGQECDDRAKFANGCIRERGHAKQESTARARQESGDRPRIVRSCNRRSRQPKLCFT